MQPLWQRGRHFLQGCLTAQHGLRHAGQRQRAGGMDFAAIAQAACSACIPRSSTFRRLPHLARTLRSDARDDDLQAMIPVTICARGRAALPGISSFAVRPTARDDDFRAREAGNLFLRRPASFRQYGSLCRARGRPRKRTIARCRTDAPRRGGGNTNNLD